MSNENFQKQLAWIQIAATGTVALGAVIISLGLTMMSLFTDIPLPVENRINLNAFVQAVILIGVGIIVIGLSTSYWRIKRVKIDNSSDKKSKSKVLGSSILFDEMYDGKDIELGKLGYDTHSVKKIRLTGEPLKYDYSVLKYAETNKMILVTEDGENYGGCIENGLQCIKLGQNPTVEEIVNGLDDLKKANESKK